MQCFNEFENGDRLRVRYREAKTIFRCLPWCRTIQQVHSASYGARRLKYWQKQAWNRFVLVHPEFNLNDDELIAALKICWLHGTDLKPEEVKVIDGHVDYTDSYARAKARQFPYSATNPVYGESARFPGGSTTVWFCSECRKVEAAWEAKHT